MLAHAGVPPAPHDLAGAWNLDPLLLLSLAALVAVYARHVQVLWRDGRRGTGIGERQVVAFGAAVLALLVALVSPLDALGGALFVAHMLQHLLLILVAAPLLLAGRVQLALVAVLPLDVRRRAGRRLARGFRRAGPLAIVAAVAVHVAVVLVWHLPPLYEAAVRIEAVHVLEHATMLGSAVMFWAAMGAGSPRPVAAAGLAAFATALASILLSAAMSMATHPWYASHVDAAAAWGLTALEDQQAAGGLMWIAGGFVYLGATGAAVLRWLHHDERTNALRAGRARS